MVRLLNDLLLIASLLICPFQCLGLVGATPVLAGESQSCSCCSDPSAVPSEPYTENDSVPREQGSSAPVQDCRCGSCLCKGAVLTNDDFVGDVLTADHWVVDLLPQAAALSEGGLMLQVDTGPPDAVSIAGRPLRLLLHSLRI